MPATAGPILDNTSAILERKPPLFSSSSPLPVLLPAINSNNAVCFSCSDNVLSASILCSVASSEADAPDIFIPTSGAEIIF